MSLVAQMADDLQAVERRRQSPPVDIPQEATASASPAQALPLFAAAEQLHAQSKKRNGLAIGVGLFAVAAIAFFGWLTSDKVLSINTPLNPASAPLQASLSSSSSLTASDRLPDTVGTGVKAEVQTLEPAQTPSITVQEPALGKAIIQDTATVETGFIEPVIEPIAEPIAEATAEPIVESRAESRLESKTEQIAKPATGSTVSEIAVVKQDTQPMPAAVIQEDEAVIPQTTEQARFVKTSNRLGQDQQLFEAATQAIQQRKIAEAKSLLAETFDDLAPPAYSDYTQSGSLYVGLLVKQKNYAQADALIADFRAFLPDSPDFVKHEIRLRLAQQRYEEAQQLLRLDVAQNSKDSEFLAFQATIYQRQKDWPLAVAAYQQLLQKNSQRADYWMGLAVAHDAQRQSNAAKNAYEQAVSLGRLSANLERYAMTRIAQL